MLSVAAALLLLPLLVGLWLVTMGAVSEGHWADASGCACVLIAVLLTILWLLT